MLYWVDTSINSIILILQCLLLYSVFQLDSVLWTGLLISKCAIQSLPPYLTYGYSFLGRLLIGQSKYIEYESNYLFIFLTNLQLIAVINRATIRSRLKDYTDCYEISLMTLFRHFGVTAYSFLSRYYVLFNTCLISWASAYVSANTRWDVRTYW